MIELKNVSKIFNSEGVSIEAVKNVNLQINDGEIYGIIGYSGAGKSTLVRCINLLERPTEGEVLIERINLLQLSAKELRLKRRQIGMIFQHFNLMPSRTIAQNVAFPLKHSGLSKEQIKNKVSELLELVELSDKVNAYPSQLSGGQKQRVAIARALANNPKVLLCDEATSALDPQTTQSILQLLKRLNEELKLTIVIITHEMNVIKEICDRVAVMEKGLIVEEGDVFDVFSHPKQEVTSKFIDITSSLSKINKLFESNSSVIDIKPGEKILKLKYLEKNVNEPLISTLSRKFELDLNIIYADIEIIKDVPLGGTVVLVSGEPANIEQAIGYLKDKNVGVEVLRQ